MKRDAWLIAYSHDHQHGLAQALRLRNAARADDPARLAATVEEALAFADGELAQHMAAEETELLPLAAQLGCLDGDDAARVAADHLRLRTLRNQLAHEPTSARIAREFAEALHDHIRWEERHLFQRWQRSLAERGATVPEPGTRPSREASAIARAVPQQAPGANGLALGKLNATNVALAPGARIDPATIDRDIAYVVVDGDGLLITTADDDAPTEHELTPGLTIALASGARRELVAGGHGLRFTTVHLRRGGLEIERAGA